MASKLKIKVNGLVHNVTASLDTPLLYVLHNELHLHGPRFGCGLAQCGACSVLLDGKEIRSCVTPVAAVSGKAITTLEGMRRPVREVARHDRVEPGCAASAAAGVDRRAGAALRLLPERDDDPGRRPSGDDEEADGGADPHRDERASLPLRHVSADPHGDPEGRGRDGEGWEVAMTEMLNKEFSRKTFVKGGGAMVVGCPPSPAPAQAATARTPFGQRGPGDYLPDLNTDRLVDRHHHRQQGHRHARRDRARPRHPDRHPHARRRGAGHGHGPDGLRTIPRPGSTRTGGGGGSGGISQRSHADPRCGCVREAGAARTWPRRTSASRWRASRSTSGVVSGGGKTVTYGALIGGKQFNFTMSAAQTSATPGQGIAKPVKRVQDRRQLVPAHRHPGQGERPVHVRPQHQDPGDGARPDRASARRRGEHVAEPLPGERRRDLDQEHPGRAGRAGSTTSSPSWRRRSTTRSRRRRS